MANSQLFKDLTACFQASILAYHTTGMRQVCSAEKDRGVISCTAALFEETTGQASLDITPAQEKTLKRQLLVAAGPAGKQPWLGHVEPADIVKARDAIFNNALKAGLIKRAPAAF